MLDGTWGLMPPAPPAVVQSNQCQPGYTYSDWELVKEERKMEDSRGRSLPPLPAYPHRYLHPGRN
jgi:hypothetical protein